MNIVFMGTPEFSVPCLESLINSNHTVVGIFTQPDKPKGRGNVLTPPPVKILAEQHKIPVFQPTKMRDGTALAMLKELNPDVIVVAAYGKILPKDIIDYPKYGCINVHASLLPRYRGAGPIQWCVINGEKETGITIMQMDVGLDTGDMLKSEKITISENETAGELHDRLSLIGGGLLLSVLDDIDSIKPQKQNDELSNYAPMLSKDLCPIDWTKSAEEVHNLVRGLNPWPVATAKYNDNMFKIFSTQIVDGSGKPGEIISTSPLTVACADKAVQICVLQKEGKKRLDSEDFLRGYPMKTGDFFE